MLFDQVKKGEYTMPTEDWHDVSDDAKELVRGCMCVDEEHRLTAQQVTFP
jgi:hypothetical protein